MHFYDMTNDGRVELIVGRDDGLIEIYTISDTNTVELMQTFVSVRVCAYTHSQPCDESITSLECGRVHSASHNEIVATTYTGARVAAPHTHPTGWILAVTTEPPQAYTQPSTVTKSLDVQLNPIAEAKVRQMKYVRARMMCSVTRVELRSTNFNNKSSPNARNIMNRQARKR
jgi:hypothetical protein